MIQGDSASAKTVIFDKHEAMVPADNHPHAHGIFSLADFETFHMPVSMQLKSFVTYSKPTESINFQPLKIDNKSGDWHGLIVLLMFSIIVLTKILYPRRFNQFIQASFSNAGLHLLLREWHPIRNILTYLYGFVYLAGFSVIILEVLDYLGSGFEITGNSYYDFLIVFSGVVFIIVGKFQTILWLSIIFNLKDSGIRYLANQIIFSLMTSLLFIPALLVLIYNPSNIAVVSTLSILLIVQLIRFLRSFMVGLAEKGIHLFYLFLYLCALEIVPLLLLAKTMMILSEDGVFG
ncbi:MAG: DUF4271 domain-containing protein [Bacteroidales bacterium]|nr:DUF4271 domain-containing protein [Bacteroidales bacterium]